MRQEEFISSALKGGYQPYFFKGQAVGKSVSGEYIPAIFDSIAINPQAWKAVLKSKGFPEGLECEFMMRMVKDLCSGMTLEEHISNL